MKIKGNGSDHIHRAQQTPLNKVEGSEHESEKISFKGKDELSLSENSRILANATKALSQMDGVRMEKVEAVKQQIENGVYQVPYEKLAVILENRLVKF